MEAREAAAVPAAAVPRAAGSGSWPRTRASSRRGTSGSGTGQPEEGKDRPAGEPKGVSLSEGQRENSTLVTGLRDFVPLVFEPDTPVEAPVNASFRTLHLPTTENGLGSVPRAKAGACRW